MPKLFWLSDEQWAQIKPHVPKSHAGARRVDDLSVISGIIHVLKSSCRWCDCARAYGSSATIYNRFNRWSGRGFWANLVEALAASGAVTKSTSIDSTYVKAQRSAHGGKGGADAGDRHLARRPDDQDPCPHGHARAALRLRADRRQVPRHKGREPAPGPDQASAIPNRRKELQRQCHPQEATPGRHGSRHPRAQQPQAQIVYDTALYRERHLIENAFCRIKDFRRVATRHDKLVRNFLSAVAIAVLVAFWI